MDGAKRNKSLKYPGVYYREHPTRRHKGKSDRIYEFTYKDAYNKTRRASVGWSSEGKTEIYAYQERGRYKEAVRKGEDPVAKKVAKTKEYTLDSAWEDYKRYLDFENKHTGPEENRYKNHIGSKFGRYTLDELCPLDWPKIRNDYENSGMALGTVKHILALIRRVINHALANEKWKGSNPLNKSKQFKMPTVKNQGERFLTRDEVQKLLQALQPRSIQLFDMSYLSLKFGFRSTELFKLKREDVDFEANLIWLTSKGGERVSVPIDKSGMEVLKRYKKRKHGQFVFQNKNGEQVIEISQTFNRVVDELRLNEGITDRRQKVWFHTLRRTFASWLAQSGKVTLLELKEMLRHEDLDSTLIYARLIPGNTQKTYAIIDRILEG
jgi:integrase